MFVTASVALLTVACGVFSVYFLYFRNYKSSKAPTLEDLRQPGWFGTGDPHKTTDNEIKPFRVEVSDSQLEDLQHRLAATRFIDPLEDCPNFRYGFNSAQLRKVITYWREQFDWRRQEALLNGYPNFTTQIEGLDVHFVHVKPSTASGKSVKRTIPLLVVHGWPGSVWEYYKSFPLLTEPDEDGLAFEVVAPSIPGYGWSESPRKKGFNAAAAARIFNNLMTERLGYNSGYVVHGGDWGWFVVRLIGMMYPERTLGVHLLGNWSITHSYSSEYPLMKAKIWLGQHLPWLFFPPSSLARDCEKIYPLEEKFARFGPEETGYQRLQGTKPDTLGQGLNDSPAGLAAYILEKFSSWTSLANRDKEDGGFDESLKFSLDELLTNVSVYWFAGNIAASQRFYKENLALGHLEDGYLTVPAAVVDAPNEVVRGPRAFIEHRYARLVQYSDLPRGGHFTAFEEPELVCEDIRRFVRKL